VAGSKSLRDKDTLIPLTTSNPEPLLFMTAVDISLSLINNWQICHKLKLIFA